MGPLARRRRAEVLRICRGEQARSRKRHDIAVAGEGPLDQETTDRLRTELSAALSAEIDLLDLGRAAGLILRESLTGGVRVRVHDGALLARFISRMLFYEADMMPNFRMTVEHNSKAFVDEAGRHP